MDGLARWVRLSRSWRSGNCRRRGRDERRGRQRVRAANGRSVRRQPECKEAEPMKAIIAIATALTLTQGLDTGKLDRFLDRLAEKNKGMGSVVIAKDGNVVYSHSFGYSYVDGTGKKPA